MLPRLTTSVLESEPAKPVLTAIQHYLVRLKAEQHPLLHGLFCSKAAEKMLSYTTPVLGTGRDGNGTERERDGNGTERDQ